MTDAMTTPAQETAASVPPPDPFWGDATPAVSVRRCPWCSEALPADATDQCPACHVLLASEGETRLPGLTEVEAPAVARARRAEPAKRSKLLSWISGDVDDVSGSPLGRLDPDAVALPPRDVRREMLRLKLEAEGLTVTPDGLIELPADAAPETPDVAVAAADSSVVTDAAPAPAEEIRKAS